MNIQTIAAYALSTGADMKYKAFSPEAWAKAAEVTLMGMGLIFVVLSVLWFVLYIFKLVFAKNTVSDKKKNAEEAKTAVTAAPTEQTSTAVTVGSDDGELVAVLTAAIAAYRASEEGCEGESVNGFRVVSFKRAAKGRAWNSNK